MKTFLNKFAVIMAVLHLVCLVLSVFLIYTAIDFEAAKHSIVQAIFNSSAFYFWCLASLKKDKK